MWTLHLLTVLCFVLLGEQTRSTIPFELDREARPRGEIDRVVFAQLGRLGISPARPCSDAVFLRRVHLDVIGVLPTPAEARRFLEDDRQDKRSRLIESLFSRQEFVDYWSMRWCDLLRVKSEFPINLWPNATFAYHRWIRDAIRDNLPYDCFARELLTSSGSNFRVPPVNFYRAVQGTEPEQIARAVALTFMGVRAESWPDERLEGMAAFFARVGFKKTAEWKEEIVFFDRTLSPRRAQFPDGTRPHLGPDTDPRQVFADWLITEQNPWFSRNIVNRLWAWLQGRGIVHQADDLRPDNPPSNAPLLALLERELVRSGYDLQQMFRLILNSETYQLSSIPASDHELAEANFASYPVRRLDAELIIDALCQITGSTEEYSSRIPEPFSFIPEEQRSAELPDGSISSPFLELFGRPPRDTGLLSERNNQPTAAQRLHLLNSSHVQRKIDASRRLRSLARQRGKPRALVNQIYLLVLSRYPTEAELQVARQYLALRDGNRRQTAIDLIWALLNSAEFLYRH